MIKSFFSIKNLTVTVGEKTIVNKFNLEIKPGQIHILMGPNGSGKSTLAFALAGHPDYTISGGQIILDGQDITGVTPDKRAKAGLFLAYQAPPAIPGVSFGTMLHAALEKNSRSAIYDSLEKVGLAKTDAARSVNDGLSGGEKKRSEIAQMLVLNPKMVILDEIDSGLDVDALKSIAKIVRQFITPEKGCLVITHYQRFLDLIKPDVVHVMRKGSIVQSGDHTLGKKVEKQGYGN